MAKILILDEKSARGDELIKSLGAAGHEVKAATGPEEAGLLLASFKPSLLIINILHPGFNTLAFISDVRKDPRQEGLKILVLSLTVWAERVSGPQSWVSTYLSKPVPMDVLKKALEKAVGGPLEGKRVLIAEDDEDLGTLIKHYLESQKATARVETDGYAAVRAAQAQEADLLLLDIMLPGLNGFEILKILKDSPASSLPVVVLSAMRLNVYQDKGLLTGEPEIIAQTVPTEYILEVTSKLLGLPA